MINPFHPQRHNGDTYFKTHYAEHNLVRAKNQFALVADIEKHMDEMNTIIADLGEICKICEIPNLEKYGVDKERFFEVMDKMADDVRAECGIKHQSVCSFRE